MHKFLNRVWRMVNDLAGTAGEDTLFQAGADALCSDIVAVLAPRDAMLGRIIARDGLELSAARRRLAAQPDDAFYARTGVSVLDNAGSEEELRRQARTWLAAAERRWSTT